MTLPNFVVIGAYKSGTTSLYQYLKEHPEIFLSSVKEMSYLAYEDGVTPRSIWGTPIVRDLNQFLIRSISAYQNNFKSVNSEKAIGDVSPMYMASAVAPERIKHYLEDVKIIAILRNPVDRAYSAYLMHVRNGRENRNMEDIILENPFEERIIRTGFYYPQLKRYFDLFDADKIRILIFEEFKANTVKVMQDVYRFLGVTDSFVPNVNIIHNVGGIPKHPKLYRLGLGRRFWIIQRYLPSLSRIVTKPLRGVRISVINREFIKAPELPADVRYKLKEVYRGDILQLQNMLKRDLSAWLI